MFLRSSFNPVSFSPMAFNGARKPPENSGRSGYWRLFFHQLQEQALEEKKPKKPARVIKFEPVKELPDGSAVVGVRSAKPEQVPPEPDQAPSEPYLFKPTPLKPEVDEPSEPYVIQTMRLSMEVSRLFTSWQIPLIITQAQDVEDEELLLLLAA